MISNNAYFIITGGPGVGKTTLLAELKRRGARCVDEVARDIIRQQVRDGGNALPWGDTMRYAELMHRRSVETYQEAGDEGPVFFDRGIPDTLSYLRLIGRDIPAAMDEDARNIRYNSTVFILPPWQEIYGTDTERKQDWPEAVRTFGQLQKTYGEYGYQLVELPKTSVGERAGLLLQRTNTHI
ncbi:AAA family ATPase [Puia sp. P3]|uniref:AAA family ATPase n=1 Tax=Puia sp. P3 TaxID=3423952 RepID=UPI003D67FF4D